LDWVDGDPKRFAMLHGAERSEGDLAASLVVPPDVGVELRDELVDGRVQPVPRVEQFVLQSAKEALALSVIGGSSLA
jgi:hypothetical protein